MAGAATKDGRLIKAISQRSSFSMPFLFPLKMLGVSYTFYGPKNSNADQFLRTPGTPRQQTLYWGVVLGSALPFMSITSVQCSARETSISSFATFVFLHQQHPMRQELHNPTNTKHSEGFYIATLPSYPLHGRDGRIWSTTEEAGRVVPVKSAKSR